MQYNTTSSMNAGEEPPPPPPLPPPILLSNDLSPANFFMEQPNQLPMQNNYNSQVGCDNIDWAGLLSGSSIITNNGTHHEQNATMSNVSINPRNIMMEAGEQQQQLQGQHGGLFRQQLQEQHGGLNRDKGKFRKRKYVPPRIAFHTRSTEDILDDGYKWRKYGQKAVKNSTHPRSYYRCTHHTCNVKKQIQRLSKDTSIVVTTYEGIHNHPCEKLMETLSPLLKQLQFLSRF
ncbi:probable WRKY transcription factor 56 [Lycium barbarum]|uniref:probable WRKY transcription factor 56 n=1 Tax=Lycium barbarum TaxID=112863 RepID=UPI00293ED544|nr:probable WRKY transcription factor 56 [Lycium barbarum]